MNHYGSTQLSIYPLRSRFVEIRAIRVNSVVNFSVTAQSKFVSLLLRVVTPISPNVFRPCYGCYGCNPDFALACCTSEGNWDRYGFCRLK